MVLYTIKKKSQCKPTSANEGENRFKSTNVMGHRAGLSCANNGPRAVKMDMKHMYIDSPGERQNFGTSMRALKTGSNINYGWKSIQIGQLYRVYGFFRPPGSPLEQITVPGLLK